MTIDFRELARQARLKRLAAEQADPEPRANSPEDVGYRPPREEPAPTYDVVHRPTIEQEKREALERIDRLARSHGLERLSLPVELELSTPFTRDAAAKLDQVAREVEAGHALREDYTEALTAWERAWRRAFTEWSRRSP